MYQPWWLTDTYDRDMAVPKQFEELAGPHGVALVRAYPNGQTDPGWGLQSKDGKPTFMAKYEAKNFSPNSVIWGYERGNWSFAFIMRSMKLICIDIDGKNGGFNHAGKLGMLPLTLAETSRSGDGYHLFYRVSEEEWNELTGFGAYSDRIGIEQGVDIRATGCVYHYPSQRWNGRHIAELTLHLKDKLLQYQQRKAAAAANIVKTLELEDPEEALMMQSELLADLAKPIPAGRRNNTLFAIGQQLKLAQIPDWETALHERATQVGLDIDEANKLVANVGKYI